jgi:gamma-glutamyltranspeptidase/glutathione hydrolase
MNRILKHRQNPQAAADAPRWRVISGRQVGVEPGFDKGLIKALETLGHDIIIKSPEDSFAFGSAQIVMRDASGHYIAGSDGRKDGMAIAI